ncbi:hypothetical protein V6N11_082661 [Hibiscus sabdariffa]|uniref:Reverse transcriptase/retrotransposon-derived protein RNase H-like domain-containing protein n=1 Tax=Hibiscus sabdariffa TaxID=183260 RepID=A0ABR2P9A8_9ROSI
MKFRTCHGRLEQNQAYFLPVQIFRQGSRFSRPRRGQQIFPLTLRVANQSPPEIPGEAEIGNKRVSAAKKMQQTKLVEKKGKTFDFNTTCLEAFNQLKEKPVSAPIVVPPDRTLPFELMYDASW